MAKGSNISAWILLVVLAVCLQVVFIFADCKQSATQTAVDFAKAYFLLDSDMETHLCSDLAGGGDESAADEYIRAM